MAFGYVGNSLFLGDSCWNIYIVVECHTCSLHSNGSEGRHTLKDKRQRCKIVIGEYR